MLQMDSLIGYKIDLKCKNILLEYEQLQNLNDVIYSLLEDEDSVIRIRHIEFVKSISLLTLNCYGSHGRRIMVGKMFAELLSKKVLSIAAITQGIDAILYDWKDYLTDCSQFFANIAAIIAPLLSSNSFHLINLIHFCTSVQPDNSSELLNEVFNTILSSKKTQNMNEVLNKSFKSILNKMSYDNISSLIGHFKALHFHNTDCLEITVHSVFEKAIEEHFAPLCSILCSAMQFVSVISKDGKKVSFKTLIINKCQCLFEIDYEIQEMDSAKKMTKINFCKDPEKKKKLQLQFEENIRRLYKRFVGNSRFMGELVKQKVIIPNITVYCIRNLVTKHFDASLECLCILLNTFGKDLEQSSNLNDTFNKLEAIMSKDMESMIPSRIRFMIQDVIDLRRNKWIPRRIGSKLNYNLGIHTIDLSQKQVFKEAVTTIIKNDDNLNDKKLCFSPTMSNKNTLRNPIIISESNRKPRLSREFQKLMKKTLSDTRKILLYTQLTPSIDSSSLQNTDTVEEPVLLVLNSEAAVIFKKKCKQMLLEYEQLKNLNGIIYSLLEEESSVIRKRHKEFVKSILLITLESNSITLTTVAGKLFTKLLSKKILSIAAVAQGIDGVLKDWKDHLMDFPQFFYYIATIIAPLLLSESTSFNFNSLLDCCISIRPDNSSIFFTEVLNKILSSNDTQNIKEHLRGILWLYNKWGSTENVNLDVFMPINQMDEYFKNNLIGVFLLSIALYDKVKRTDSVIMYIILLKWITNNINAEIIKDSQFVRALTIALVMERSKLNYLYDDFFDQDHVKLLNYYIHSETLTELEVQAREVQCLYGIQIVSAILQHPGGMVLKLSNKLFQESVISKESFELFIEEYEEIADL